MSDNTTIEWTDATWNPITGCSVVSPGCANCYAMQLAGTRLRNHPSRRGLTRVSAGRHVWNGQVRYNHEWLDQPFGWPQRMIFVCAHGDLFHDAVEQWMIAEIFGVMIASHHIRGHIFQVLTKRAERMRQLLNDPEFWEEVMDAASSQVMERVDPLDRRSDDARATMRDYDAANPPPGIWLGVSVEDQQRADERIPLLLQTPATVRWLSCEPLLGPVDLEGPCELAGIDRGKTWGEMGDAQRACRALRYGDTSRLDWVVCGGESGKSARPMHPGWARSLRDQCDEAGVPFFFKQWGEWAEAGDENPSALLQQSSEDRIFSADGRVFGAGTRKHGGMVEEGWQAAGAAWMARVGKKLAGRLLDGVEHNAYPVTP
jgi:protein gp37